MKVIPTTNSNLQMLKRSVSISVSVNLTLLAIFFGGPSNAVEFSNKHNQWMSLQAHTSLQDIGNLKHEEELAKGKFLVASRRLRDPNFSETVILLIHYGQGGAMGLVINRPSEVKLSTVIPEIKELEQLQDTVHIGGPVAINTLLLLIRSANRPEASILVFEDVYISSNRTVLKQMIKKPAKEERFRIYAGYAGWAPKQLEFELNRGDWHVLKADARMVFDKKHSEVWQELIHRTSVKWVHTKRPLYSKESGLSIIERAGRNPNTKHFKAIKTRNPYRVPGLYEKIFGGVLLSRPAARAVPSALKSLTAVFGMGTGVASSP